MLCSTSILGFAIFGGIPLLISVLLFLYLLIATLVLYLKAKSDERTRKLKRNGLWILFILLFFCSFAFDQISLDPIFLLLFFGLFLVGILINRKLGLLEAKKWQIILLMSLAVISLVLTLAKSIQHNSDSQTQSTNLGCSDGIL